jgi:ADP-heptose:LPS heptosyltransferase
MKLWFERGAWASKRGRKKVAELSVTDVRSVAIIRHAALGDMVLIRPFIFELRKFFPNAKITLSVVSNYTYGVPEDLIDRLHVAYGNDQRDIPKLEQFKRIKELGYHEIIFDMASTSRSHLVTLLNKARIKVGFPYRNMLRNLLYDVAVLRSDFRFEADTIMDMLHVFGCDSRYPLQFDLEINTALQQQPYILYFPSASTKSKCWPLSSFSELIKQMAGEHAEYQHVVLEGIAEWESIKEIIEPLKTLANVKGIKAESLENTLNLVKHTKLLVSNDTGIRNLAIAADTSTLGIFFTTIPYRYWPRGDKHDAAFNADGSMPDVSKVKHKISLLLENNG